MIAKAKEKLLVTTLSVAEIAYQLGFERPQSFNKLFKAKMAMSPLEFRRAAHAGGAAVSGGGAAYR